MTSKILQYEEHHALKQFKRNCKLIHHYNIQPHKSENDEKQSH